MERKEGNPSSKQGKPKRKFNRQLDSTIEKPIQPNAHYKTITHFITSQTNFLELFQENFDIPSAEDFTGICLAGLHTCGDLGPSCLRIYNASEHIVSVCNVGCCYHLLNEKYVRFEHKRIRRVRDERSRSPPCCEADVPLDELNAFGFPMSRYLNECETALGRNARMLSCQSMHRTIDQKEKPHQHLFYRALLEVLIADKYPEYRSSIEVGRLKTCTTFAEYVRKSSKRNPHINFDDMTDDTLNQLHGHYANVEQQMIVYHFLRISIANVIETVILLDRLLYLLEIDESNSEAGNRRHSHLVRFFDPVKSPRCYGLISMKY